jgi:hypothetical protein
MTAAIVAGDDDMGEIGRRRDAVLEFRQQFRRYHQQPRPRIRQDETVIVLGHQRVDRHRHHAGLDGAEKGGRPVDGVGQADQDAFFAANTEAAQHMAEAVDPVGQRGIGADAAIVDEGRLATAAGVEIVRKKGGREIVIARHGDCPRSRVGHRGVSPRGAVIAHACPL